MKSITLLLLFLFLVRKKSKQVVVDERIQNIGGQAAKMAFVLFVLIMACLSILFIIVGNTGDDVYLEGLGTILAYSVMLALAIYSIAYKFYNRKHGGENDK